MTVTCQHLRDNRCQQYGIPAHWCGLCQRKPQYRKLWERGIGPGQQAGTLPTSLQAAAEPVREAAVLQSLGRHHLLYAPKAEVRRRYAICRRCEYLHGQWRCTKISGCTGHAKGRYMRQLGLLHGVCYDGRWQRDATLIHAYPETKWITTSRLTRDSLRLIDVLPPTLDAVCGIARSGLLAATPIAVKLHLPLFAGSADGVVHTGYGGRMNGTRIDRCRHVLAVDDTNYTGANKAIVLPQIRRAFRGARIELAVIYTPLKLIGLADYVAAVYPLPHYLEWCWPNVGYMTGQGMDMDGLICDDFPSRADDAGSRYAEAIKSRQPKHLPRKFPVVVITARPEAFRSQTTAWLRRHKARVRELVMWPGEPDARWSGPDVVADWKADMIRSRGLDYYAESDPRQARRIADRCPGVRVICPAAGEVFCR